jgi:hypothetical protein
MDETADKRRNTLETGEGNWNAYLRYGNSSWIMERVESSDALPDNELLILLLGFPR